MRRIALGLLAAFLCIAWVNLAPSAEPEPDFQHLPQAAEAILAQPDRLELFSLDPSESDEKPVNVFHRWKVLGSTVITDAKTQRELVSAFKRGISENKGFVAVCFNPRHGLRAKQGDMTVDIVICFECLSMKVHLADKESSVWTTNSPQPTFDRILTKANIPLAKKPNES